MTALDVDVLIVGAGPVGLFGAYYAGVRGLRTALVDSLSRDYGRVRIVRVTDQVGYVGELDGQFVGRYRTLRAALEAVHLAFVRSHGPGPFQGYPKFEPREWDRGDGT